MSINGAGAIKTALIMKILSEFDTSAVSGITEVPLIIQDRPLESIVEPYVYLTYEDSFETDVTQTGSSIDYFFNAQVVVRTAQNEDGTRLRDEIVAEVSRIIDTPTSGYIDIETLGFNVYLQNVDSVEELDKIEERGATYFEAAIAINVRANFIGLPSTNPPIQPAQYTFTDFTFTPTQNRIEFGDAGTITGATTYANQSPWNFTSVTYAQIAGGDGSLATNVYTVESGDATLGLIATLNYTFATDNIITQTITDTDNFNRIRSLRFGTIDQGTINQQMLADFSQFQGTNKTFRYGVDNPIGQEISFEGTAGDRLYIVYDAAHTIRILRDQFGFNHLDAFTETTVNGYKVLLQTNPLVFDTSAPIRYTIG